MANYIVYKPNEDGRIVRTGFCPVEAIPQKAVYPGEVAMEGTANDATQKISKDGKVVEKDQ
jgi:hypothetical protein